MSMLAPNDVSTSRAPAAHADALVVVHGRSVGCKFELRRRQSTIGGGVGDAGGGPADGVQVGDVQAKLAGQGGVAAVVVAALAAGVADLAGMGGLLRWL